jgi:hypothetical protein
MRFTCIAVVLFIVLLVGSLSNSFVPCSGGNDPDGIPLCDLKPGLRAAPPDGVPVIAF